MDRRPNLVLADKSRGVLPQRLFNASVSVLARRAPSATRRAIGRRAESTCGGMAARTRAQCPSTTPDASVASMPAQCRAASGQLGARLRRGGPLPRPQAVQPRVAGLWQPSRGRQRWLSPRQLPRPRRRPLPSLCRVLRARRAAQRTIQRRPPICQARVGNVGGRAGRATKAAQLFGGHDRDAEEVGGNEDRQSSL
jgi:hypothetical protein